MTAKQPESLSGLIPAASQGTLECGGFEVAYVTSRVEPDWWVAVGHVAEPPAAQGPACRTFVGAGGSEEEALADLMAQVCQPRGDGDDTFVTAWSLG